MNDEGTGSSSIPMRVSVLVPDVGGAGGGAGTTLPTIAYGMKSLGVDVELLVIRATPAQIADYTEFPIHLLGASRMALSVPAIVRHLRKREPQVLLSGPGPMNIAAIIAGRLTNTRIFITEHGMLSLDTKLEYGRTSKLRLLPFLMKRLYPYADGIIAPSDAPLKDSLFASSVSLSRIPHAVVPNPLRWDAEELMLQNVSHPWLTQEALNLTPTIVSAGRLAEQKRFDVLIRAVAILRDSGREVRLMILGEGPKRESLQALVEDLRLLDHVSLPGDVANPFSFFRSASLFALSSQWESFGNVIIEAMACDVPVVSTAAPTGPTTIIEDGVNGLLVPVDDADELASAIARVLADSALAQRLRAGGLKTATTYMPNASAMQYIAFFQEVLSK